MRYYALVFFVIAVVAAIFGFNNRMFNARRVP
jgi:uncharacterized membrane protein YtjA (UPF0391 family)